MQPYIEVRGVWPVFFVGMSAIVLVGADRNISLRQAALWIVKNY